MDADRRAQLALRVFEDVCATAGGLVALANLLGKPKQTVNHYRHGFPEEVCPLVEEKTGCRCERLNADVRWRRGEPEPGWPNGKPLIDKTPVATPTEPAKAA